LKVLLRDGLIEVPHNARLDRHEYCIVNEKTNLSDALHYFIEKQMTTTVEYRVELERLERAADELEKALQPFGKLPKEIVKVKKELEEELKELLG
jgi:hypothetical protein